MYTTLLASLSLASLVFSTPIHASTPLKVSISKRFSVSDGTGIANMTAIFHAVDSAKGKYPSFVSGDNDSIEKRQGLESLTDQNNGMLWTGSVGFGTPPVYFPIDFDTGSDDLWVAGFDPKQSSSAVIVNSDPSSFQISYADGSSASGPIYTDTITIASLSLSSQTFSPVSQTTGMDTRTSAGIAGLAFSPLSQLSSANLVERLFQQGAISQKSFSFALKTSGAATLCLGCIDSSAIAAPIKYTPVLSPSYWMVKGNVFIAGVNNGRPLAARQGMIIDTGTTLLVGPSSAVTRIFSLVPGVAASSVGSGYYDAPCNNIPIISLGFGRLYPIPASSMNLGETYSGSGRCVLALVGGAFNDWIVGDTFLSNVYSTFDYTKNAVGFAPLA